MQAFVITNVVIKTNKPMYIRITKEFTFEMAHALLNHDGPCKNIHGHSYKLAVTIKGIPIKSANHPKTGMVADFKDIKKIVADHIIQHFDHALLINYNSPPELIATLNSQKLLLTDFQPTCENILIHIAKTLQQVLPENILLHHLCLRETDSSYAEWYAEDNEYITS